MINAAQRRLDTMGDQDAPAPDEDILDQAAFSIAQDLIDDQDYDFAQLVLKHYSERVGAKAWEMMKL